MNLIDINQPDLGENEVLELEIGQIVYWDDSAGEQCSCELIKAEVIKVDELLNRVQILPLPDEVFSLVRVPFWVSPDEISLEESTVFL